MRTSCSHAREHSLTKRLLTVSLNPNLHQHACHHTLHAQSAHTSTHPSTHLAAEQLHASSTCLAASTACTPTQSPHQHWLTFIPTLVCTQHDHMVPPPSKSYTKVLPCQDHPAPPSLPSTSLMPPLVHPPPSCHLPHATTTPPRHAATNTALCWALHAGATACGTVDPLCPLSCTYPLCPPCCVQMARLLSLLVLVGMLAAAQVCSPPLVRC